MDLHGVNPFVLTCQASPGCSVHQFATYQCIPVHQGATVTLWARLQCLSRTLESEKGGCRRGYRLGGLE